jgi:hypothetical protein
MGITKPEYRELKVTLGEEDWHYDTLPEFLGAMNQCSAYYFYVVKHDRSVQLQVNYYSGASTVWALAPERAEIESIFSIFEGE